MPDRDGPRRRLSAPPCLTLRTAARSAFTVATVAGTAAVLVATDVVPAWTGALIGLLAATATATASATATHRSRRAGEARERERFVEHVAHELRTPLAVVVTALELAAQDVAPGPGRDRVELALQESRRVNLITTALLALTTGSTTPRRGLDPTLVGEAAWRAVARVSIPAHVEIELACGPYAVLVEAVHLEILVSNLVVNAARFATSRIRVGAAIDLRAPDRSITLSVEDDGPGFAEALLRHGPARYRTVPERSGTGLGLALVEAVASRYGATLAIGVSVTLGGAMVEVLLPAEAAASSATSTRRATC